MSDDAIKKAISELRLEDEALAEQERKTARRRAQISTALSSLLALESDETVSFEGTLADACRHALIESSTPMTVPDIRVMIELFGYNVRKHRNILASIHSALKRFKQARQVQEGERNGKTTYQWIGRSKPVLEITTTPQPPAPKPPTPLKTAGSVALGKPITQSIGEIALAHSERFKGASIMSGVAEMVDSGKALSRALTEQMTLGKAAQEAMSKALGTNLSAMDLSHIRTAAEQAQKAMGQIDMDQLNYTALMLKGLKVPKF